MVRDVVAGWFPDRSPKRIEVLLTALAVLQVGTSLIVTSNVWHWVAVGFAVSLVGMGPASDTVVGTRIGSWFRAIGVVGRATVVVLFAVVVWSLFLFSSIPPDLLTSLGDGALLGVIVFGLAFLLRAGDIDGWWPPHDA